MKLSGYWVYSISILALIFLICPAYADEIYPTITHVFFEKDGLPYNESVYFTVECYGYTWKSWDGSDPEDLKAKVNHPSEKGYSFSASCPSYGCIIYEPNIHAGRMFVDHCDVAGTAGGKPFMITNFSKTPLPDCTELQPYMMGSGSGGYYNGTPAYDECVNETRRHRDRCDQYLVSCDPADDTECGNWVMEGKYVKETSSYHACMDTIDRERMDCDQLLEKINPSTMVMWKYDNYQEEPAKRACELHITIPAQDTGNTTIPVPVSLGTRKSPVKSLYCSILQFFGGRCE